MCNDLRPIEYYLQCLPAKANRRQTVTSCLPTAALAKVGTRENVTGNNFLYNGGTELNTTTNVYDLFFRNYDPTLGRMNQIDPMAAKYASLTPYNYSFNNPIGYNDPSGAEPPQTINHSAFYNQYYIGYTYDDRVDYTGLGDPVCGHCWRTGNSLTMYQSFTGYSTSSMGPGWRPGQSGLTPIISQWAPDFGGPVYLGLDANGNSIHALPSQIERAGGARAYFNQVYNYRLGMAAFNMVQRPLVKDEGYSGFFPVVNGRLDLANAKFYRWSAEIDLKNIVASAREQQTGGCPPGTPCDGPWLKNSVNQYHPPQNNPEGLSTSFILGTSFTAGKNVATKARLEILRQIKINNSLRGPSVQFDGPLKVPNGVKFVASYGGYGFTAWGAYDVNSQWKSGQLSTGQMVVEQISNVIGAITYMGIGTAWSIGWNLGGQYGPSKWYGSDDTKWFK